MRPVSPLGALYRREFARLHIRYPALDPRRCDRLVVGMLARAFLDADAAELARAVREGSPHLADRFGSRAEHYVWPLVRHALDEAGRRDRHE